MVVDGETQAEPGAWFAVGIESRDQGRVLDAIETARGGADTPMHWKRLAQRKLRQVLELLDDDDQAELGEAFELVEVGVRAVGLRSPPPSMLLV